MQETIFNIGNECLSPADLDIILGTLNKKELENCLTQAQYQQINLQIERDNLYSKDNNKPQEFEENPKLFISPEVDLFIEKATIEQLGWLSRRARRLVLEKNTSKEVLATIK